MRRGCLLFILCLCGGFAIAQTPSGDALFFSKDSLNKIIERKVWRFTPADLPNGADTSLDDSSWPHVRSDLYIAHDTAPGGFKGIGWLRLHFVLDSAAANRMLALRIRQEGASEIYIDGKLVHSYGRLTPKDSTEYINPQYAPLGLPIIAQGQHLLAIRYANQNYLHNYDHYNSSYPGIIIALWDAGDATYFQHTNYTTVLFTLVLLFGIFITLSMVHLILYLYYRADKANLRFSLFALFVAGLFLVPAIMRASENAPFILRLSNIEPLIVAFAAASLSNLLNTLFSKKKWHAYIALASCIALIVLLCFWRSRLVYGMIVIMILVPLEAIYILVSAIWRRLPGARIIAGGLTLLILLLLVVILLALIQGDVTVNDNTLAGQLFTLTLASGLLSIPISMSMYLAWRFSHVSRDLKTQLVQVETLSAQAREQEAEKQRLLETRQEELEQQVAERTASLRAEKQKSDNLLLNILPSEVAEELKEKGSSDARLYDNVSVLFTDFVDFTQVAEHLSPAALVAEIHVCFKAFDGIIEQHGLEKIKTVGDAYIAVSGMPAANEQHAIDVVRAATAIRDFMAARKAEHPATFDVRLGVHSGPVVAGIVGVKKFAYDIWGDTVNTAARMEQHSAPGRINISATTYALVKDEFATTYRGELEAKHKGKMGMYFVG